MILVCFYTSGVLLLSAFDDQTSLDPPVCLPRHLDVDLNPSLVPPLDVDLHPSLVPPLCLSKLPPVHDLLDLSSVIPGFLKQ